MRGSVGVGRLLMAGVLVWAAAGCSSVVEGAAEPASGQEGLFDPCKDIPDSVLEEVGLDPATEEVDIAGVEQPGWRICSWTGTWFFVSVLSNRYTQIEVTRNPEYAEFVEMTIGDRAGIRFQRGSDAAADGCYVAFAATQGSVWVNVEAKAGVTHQESACELVSDVAEHLDGNLPR